MEEFKSWLLAGLSKPPEDLQRISSKGDRGQRLVDFVEAVRKDISRGCEALASTSREPSISDSSEDDKMNAIGLPPFPALPPKGMCDMWIQDTFKHFDTDGDDRLDVAELFGLCAHVKQWALKSGQIGEDGSDVRTALEDFSPRDAGMVLRIIDQDRDGSIDSREFSTWVLRGIEKSDSEMSKIMKKNSNAAKMVALVVAIRLCITDTTAKRSDLETALLSMFRKSMPMAMEYYQERIARHDAVDRGGRKQDPVSASQHQSPKRTKRTSTPYSKRPLPSSTARTL